MKNTPKRNHLVISSIAVLAIFLPAHGSAQLPSDTDFRVYRQPVTRKSIHLKNWLTQAYEGDKDAQFQLGVLFADDQYKQTDYPQAVYWYTQAARQGHTDAQYNLGHHYLNGQGVVKNEIYGLRWWLKAASAGHRSAQFNVGRAYYLGLGLPRDHEKSRHWFTQAKANGDTKSAEILKQLGWLDSKVITPTVKNTSRKLNVSTNKRIARQPTIGNPLSVALYTNPDIHQVLIDVYENYHDLRIEYADLNNENNWILLSSRKGFPVWVHADFVKRSGNQATISADRVNARAVPAITHGSKIDILNMGETLTIIEKRDNWYRLISPKQFKAWARLEDYRAAAIAARQ